MRAPTPPQCVERRHGQAHQRRGTLAGRPVGTPQGQQLRHPEHQHQRCCPQQHGSPPFQRIAVPDHAIAQLSHHETSGCRPQGQHLHLRQPFGQLPAAGEPQGGRQADDGPQPAQIPVRIFRNRASGRELGLAITVEDPPVAAHGAFLTPLPGLVEALDEVVVQVVVSRSLAELAHEARLVDSAGHGRIPLAAFAGPAGLSDQHVLAIEHLAHALGRAGDVVDGGVDAHRVILPVRQDVDGDERDMPGQLGVLAPELPDISVGHGHIDGTAYLIDVFGHLLRRLLTAQQHLVAHHDAADGIGVLTGQLDGTLDLDVVLVALTADPDPQQHLHAQRLGHLGHLVQPLDDRIGAHALRTGGQDGQVFAQPRFRDHGTGIQRGLAGLAERRIGDALQLVVGRIDHRLRRALGAPPSQHQQGRQHAQQGHPAGTVAGQEIEHGNGL